MPIKSATLHGSAPDKSAVALLLIDVINPLEFDGADELLAHARPMAERLAEVKRSAQAAGIPAIYVNDNFGRWRSDWRSIVGRCLEENVPGRPIVELLRPDEDDYFVLKPKHSGFYSTALDLLLAHLEANTLILTGIATNICVLFTAHDAYLRDYSLIVPADCSAANTAREHRHALDQMRGVLKADTRPWSEIAADTGLTQIAHHAEHKLTSSTQPAR